MKYWFLIILVNYSILTFGQSNDSIPLPKTVIASIFTWTPLREAPDVASEIKYKVPKGALLQVIGSNKEYLKVKYDSIEGYLIYFLVSSNTQEFSTFVKKAKKFEEERYKIEAERKRIEEERRLTKINAERKAALTKKYGSFAAIRILERKIWIGMTEAMLLDSWGEPEDINTTVNRYVTRKQYVYGLGRYVYVENGKVDAWQN
jgi:hypothetical protein